MWEDIVVYFIVAGAVGFLVKQWFLTGKGEKGCGSCKNCGPAPQEEKLVQIDLNASFKR